MPGKTAGGHPGWELHACFQGGVVFAGKKPPEATWGGSTILVSRGCHFCREKTAGGRLGQEPHTCLGLACLACLALALPGLPVPNLTVYVQNLIGHNLTHMARHNFIPPRFGTEFRCGSFWFSINQPLLGPPGPGPGPMAPWAPIGAHIY